MFDGRVPAKWKDRAPRVVHNDDDTDVWVFEGNTIPNVGLNAVVGRPPEEYGIEPTSFAEMRPGCYDIHERVRDMNANGVLGSMCFPSFVQFCGQLFARTEDKELAIDMLRAYNDWHIESWCGAYPERFIPLAIPPLWDPTLMAAEVRRVAAKGCHAITFSENPSKLGWPSFHDAALGPVLVGLRGRGHRRLPPHRVVVDAGHHRPRRALRRPDRPAAGEHHPVRGRPPVLPGAAQVPLVADRPVRRRDRMDPVLLGAGRLRLPAPQGLDGPGLRVEAAEPGVQGADRHLLHRRRLRRGEPPAPRVGQRVLGVRLPALGLDLAQRPRDGHEVPRRRPRRRGQQDHPRERHAPVPATTPFSQRPRAQCTVGALRAEATDVDVSLRPRKNGGERKRTLAADLGALAARND